MEVNQIYEMDCLDGCKEIETDSIDMIYGDIPFFTQRKFSDFNDVWKNKAEFIKYIEIRVKEFYKILKPSGSFFLHADSRTIYDLKPKIDAIFKEKNFINDIIWHYGLGAANRKRGFLKKHDIILFYAKDLKNMKFNILRGEVTPAMKTKYCHHDEQGSYMMSYGKKYYLKGGKPLDDVWNIPSISPTATERCYDTQKPKPLLKNIILCSTDVGDIVLDGFCGSGTTLIEAKKLLRNYIGFDLNSKAVTLSNNSLDNINNH